MLWCGCSVEAPTNMGRKSLTCERVRYGCGLRGAWWRDGDGSWRRGRGRLWRLSPTGLPTGSGQVPTGHYMPNEFVARGRQGSVRRWGRLWGGWWGGGGGGGGFCCGGGGGGAGGGGGFVLWGRGGGREAVVVVVVDGV